MSASAVSPARTSRGSYSDPRESPATEVLRTGNGVRDLNPATQLSLAGGLALTAVLFGPLCMVIVVTICLVLSALAGRARPFLTLFTRTILILGIAIVALQTFFVPGTTELFSWWLFTATAEGLAAGIQIASRVLGVGASVILLIQILNLDRLVLDMEQRGMSPRATYVITATVNIIPQMRKQMGVIMDAQKSRGVETDSNLWVRTQAFVPTIGPLILNSIMGVEEKALTLESRGFSATGTRTSLRYVEDRPRDKRLRVLIVCALVAIIGVRIVLWIL
ncbi:energy-coupling factor transporter transmembrane protein EcfT [Mycetocola tolaasinivorans]|uniref:Energy-coupling factor transporter transmembrane protein EcfT n=1 Tax=Mycetocola tolaasinivorans TaxID=76635 RepID=A0A3L7A2G6_9MICO|nr:energy-coupling factor transporter transmembrane component T [Mycetocola tolaasinivorans]RLP74503.1 energy-coupling factor transporter transmembrane protein EcfT [Mycetocola tolaasinivorans]